MGIERCGLCECIVLFFRFGNKVVVDFGCGDVKIVRNVLYKVYFFDLVVLNDYVIVCDMVYVSF